MAAAHANATPDSSITFKDIVFMMPVHRTALGAGG